MGPLHILLAEKEGSIWFNMMCFKIHQFGGTTWWCLSVMEYVIGSTLKHVLKSLLLKKYLKNHGLPKFASGPALGGRPNKIFGRS